MNYHKLGLLSKAQRIGNEMININPKKPSLIRAWFMYNYPHVVYIEEQRRYALCYGYLLINKVISYEEVAWFAVLSFCRAYFAGILMGTQSLPLWTMVSIL